MIWPILFDTKFKLIQVSRARAEVAQARIRP